MNYKDAVQLFSSESYLSKVAKSNFSKQNDKVKL